MTNALLSQQVGNQTANLNYDLDGNLKNDSKFHYAFDAFQRIVEVKDQSQNLVAKYQMDTSNRRISKTVGTTAHRTVYAGWQVAEEHETVPSGKKFKTTTKVYVYGQYIDEPLVMQITKPNGNQKKYWYLRNQQYSIYALTNDNGKIVETYHYSAYGEVEIKDAENATLTESAYSNSYFYTGRLLDSETNLYYFRNRYYNANQGRFISRDPLGYVDGMSLYRGYFAIGGLDPLGLEWGSTDVRPRTENLKIGCKENSDGCYERDNIIVRVTVNIKQQLIKEHKITGTKKDGAEGVWMFSQGCWRTLKNYNRTLEHEKKHRENIGIIVNELNKKFPKKFSKEGDCKEAAKKMEEEYRTRYSAEDNHDQSATPTPPVEGSTSFDEEYQDSLKENLCVPIPEVRNGKRSKPVSPAPAKPDYPDVPTPVTYGENVE